MIHTDIKTSKSTAKRILSGLAAVSFAITSVLGISSSANATEMAPVIEYDGNNLASTFIHSQFGLRPAQFQVGLESTPLNQVLSTNRSGYSFGGWSYAPGEPAVATLQTASHTTTRMWLFAVWNTKLNLNVNGSTRGQLANGEATVNYRYGQMLKLPSGGTIQKKGYEFAGWSNSTSSNVLVSTYTATADAVGNPSVYAVWKKTISFKSRGSTGSVPAPVTILEGESGITLPAAGALSRPGFEFKGWSTKPRGKVITNTTAFIPKKANANLHAVWQRAR